MGEEEARDGVLELLVSSHICGHFLSKRCLVETWVRNQGLQFSQERATVPGCAVSVACPSFPATLLSHMGQARKQKGLEYGCFGVP